MAGARIGRATIKAMAGNYQHRYTLRRIEIARSVADQLDWDLRTSCKAVTAYFEAVTEGLALDDEVVLPWLGRLWVTRFDKRVGGRYRSQRVVTVKRLFFRPSSHVYKIYRRMR